MNPSAIIVEHATARPLTAEETKHLFELFTMPGYEVLMDLMRIDMEGSVHVAMKSALQNQTETVMENEVRAEHRGAYHALARYRSLKADVKAELENPDSHN